MSISLFLIDRKKLKVLIPAYLLSSVIGFSLDVIFDFTLKYYYYINAPIPNGILSFLMETFIGPPYGMIFMQYLPKDGKSYILYLIVWTLLLTAIEAVFHINKLLIYNRWNYFFSVITYISTLLTITAQYKYLFKE
ncbi:CBO0543 family protein [Thermoanaerobacterium saccharolyticum]|uniref:CBO0543 family protein n=1 Tax=Thermoanaerobacterium saccharolyticum TaxID=28896 RepID=UPI002FDAE451